MIRSSEILPLLVEACPSFSEKWEKHKQEYYDEADYLSYIALMEFSLHLIDLHERNETGEFSAVFEAVERLHTEGEHYVREAATIGLLESIQNQLGNAGKDPEVFRSYLLPASTKWWDQLNLFWSGEIKYVGETFDS